VAGFCLARCSLMLILIPYFAVSNYMPVFYDIFYLILFLEYLEILPLCSFIKIVAFERPSAQSRRTCQFCRVKHFNGEILNLETSADVLSRVGVAFIERRPSLLILFFIVCDLSRLSQVYY
jgi:hypothetical protein